MNNLKTEKQEEQIWSTISSKELFWRKGFRKNLQWLGLVQDNAIVDLEVLQVRQNRSSSLVDLPL